MPGDINGRSAAAATRSSSSLSTSSSSSSSAAATAAASTTASSAISGASRSFSVDLVAAARRHFSFLRSDPAAAIAASSIRRYSQLWMPLLASESSTSPAMLIPPPDIRWVWHCHCLTPDAYRSFCASKFGFLVDRPPIFDDENEAYAADRCREVWEQSYPSEPFDATGDATAADDEELLLAETISRHRSLRDHFDDPFVSDNVYLVAARDRYQRFLKLLAGFSGDGEAGRRFVPASDILLIWVTHQSFPGSYEKDGVAMTAVVGFGEAATEVEKEMTRRKWEEAFGEPYELAGAVFDPAGSPARRLVRWETAAEDVNRKYRCLQLRSHMEVRVYLKGRWKESNESKNEAGNMILRLRTIRCHWELKLDDDDDTAALSPSEKEPSSRWRQAWLLFAEFSTRGISLEARPKKKKPSGCLGGGGGGKVVPKTFHWNELLRSRSLTVEKEAGGGVRALCSITPPVQAPYLLKCVPDRVTDNSGAMISDVVLAMRGHRPQEGRWLTRTVLDHAGRECFVIRIRIGRGIWRRGAETPAAVRWEDRTVEIREGSWSYIAGSIGTAPEKVVGTASPKKDPSQEKRVTWSLSNGDLLTIDWEEGLAFRIESESSPESHVELVSGRKLQYRIDGLSGRDGDEEHYLTLVRRSSRHPNGRATALLNWKLMAVEFLPEEDAVAALLLCVSVLRTVSEIRRADVGGLLVRRRAKEVGAGARDWGSVMLPPESPCLTPHLQPWYLNAEECLASAAGDGMNFNQRFFSPADGKDALYKMSILPY